MQVEDFRQKMIQRAENFSWDIKKLQNVLGERSSECLNFEILQEEVVISTYKKKFFEELDDAEKLKEVFRKTARIMEITEEEEELRRIAPGVIEVCNFMALCTFLRSSKRIKGWTDKEFVRNNSPRDFRDPDSPNYREPCLLDSDVEVLKKFRLRLFSERPVHIERKWNVMSKDAEYEWTFYYDLQKEDPDVQDAFKRLKNLYSDIRSALQSGNKKDNLKKSYKKFRSKLQKINYEKYLKLQEKILCRICENKKYYGINLYRLEKTLRPYIIIKEVKELEKCNSPQEEEEALLKMVLLDSVCFPGIYKSLYTMATEEIDLFVEVFSQYLERFIVETCLILDKFVEEGVWGDRWETLFRNISNEMAGEVLYDPETIDFSTTVDSQEKFWRILHAGVWVEICATCNRMVDLEEFLI